MRPRQARLSEAFATSATSDVGGAGVGDVEDCDDKYRASHRRRVHRASGKMLAVLVSTAAGAIIFGRLYHQKSGVIMPAGDEMINPPGSDVGDRPLPEAFIIGAPKAATTRRPRVTGAGFLKIEAPILSPDLVLVERHHIRLQSGSEELVWTLEPLQKTV